MKNWVISSLEDLPTLPSLGMAIKEHALSGQCTTESLRRLVCRDPAAALLVMREANSRAYGRSGLVDNLKEAANLLGMKSLRPLLLGLLVITPERSGAFGRPLDLIRLWNHSHAVARLASMLCGENSPELAGPAYLAGLFHDMGKLVIRFKHPRLEIGDGTGLQRDRLAAVISERKTLGVDHAELGARLLAAGHLPTTIVQGVARHHTGFEEEPHSPINAISRIVYLANRISYQFDMGCTAVDGNPGLGEPDFAIVGLSLQEGRIALDRWRQSLERMETVTDISPSREVTIEVLQQANIELGRINTASVRRQRRTVADPSIRSDLLELAAELAGCRDADEALRLVCGYLIRSLKYARVCLVTSPADNAAPGLEARRTDDGEMVIEPDHGPRNDSSADRGELRIHRLGLLFRHADALAIEGFPAATLALWDAADGTSPLPAGLERERSRLRGQLLGLCRRTLERIIQDQRFRDELAQASLQIERQRANSFRAEERTDFSQEILKKAPIGLFSIDMEGYLTSANPVFLAIAELSAVDDPRAVNILQLPSVTRSGLDKELLISLHTGKPFELTGLNYVSPAGRDYILRVQIVPQEGKETTGLIGIVEDITLRKKLEQNLIQIERLRALGEMAGSVAHDFNNLLGAILGNVQLLLSHEQNQSTAGKLAVIERLTIEGAEKVKRLQEFTRIRRDRSLEMIDVEPVLEESLELINSRAQAQGIRLELTRDRRKLPPIQGNAAELREAFFNILINAIDAMPENGKLTVKSETDRASITITFRDNGCGMPEEVRQRIFEPFFTTKGPQGSGLGMSMVYGIISRHKGEIQVASIPDKGSTIVIHLPVRESTAKEASAPSAGQKVLNQEPTHILVIDDEEVMRNALTDILKIGNHRVKTAADGMKGLELLREERFDMVISDLSMPGISGLEVLKQVKKEKPGIPSILITGWGLEMDPDEMTAAGIDKVIRKPFQLKEVLNLVAEAIHRSRTSPPAEQA
jgi:putative nucleotidyltransferase with HDIG domain